MAAVLMLESVRGVYVFRLSVGDAVGDAAIHASEEDDPCGLEKPVTKQRTTEQNGNKIRRPQTSLLVTAKQSLHKI